MVLHIVHVGTFLWFPKLCIHIGGESTPYVVHDFRFPYSKQQHPAILNFPFVLHLMQLVIASNLKT